MYWYRKAADQGDDFAQKELVQSMPRGRLADVNSKIYLKT